ncbi:MAG: nucleoside recognition domain-containing protein [Bacillota bacterium]
MSAGLHLPGSYGDAIASAVYRRAEGIAARVVRRGRPEPGWSDRLDDLVTSRWLGYPVMAALLCGALWLTITGSNYPSQGLTRGLFWLEGVLESMMLSLDAPWWLTGLLVHGTYRGVAWVVGVMLPPMAIFFPLFSLLEDFGYLPRVAFNLDRFFKGAGGHGKQALTMCMGLGCNAAGVTACRIIESPRERLIAMLTNVFVPCNGRFPLFFALASIFVSTSWLGSAVVVAVIMAGVGATLLVSLVLSRTILRGLPSSFVLELPPYRPPHVGKVLVRSLFDRTLVVLTRAVWVAAPAGAVTWVLANTYVSRVSLLAQTALALDALGRALGMDGHILLAFVLGLPANEIVVPVLVMGYMGSAALLELDGLRALGQLLVSRGWTLHTAVSVMLFSLLHYPCGTTLLTIARETRSLRWAVLGAVLPLGLAGSTCFVLNLLVKLVA